MEKFERKPQAKWDKKHLRTVSTKLNKEEYCEFVDICYRVNDTPYGVLQRYIRRDILGR